MNSLNYAIENGIIDLNTIQSQINMTKKQQYVKNHESKVWQSTDGKWYTYLPKLDKKILIKRKTKEELEDAIGDFYINQEKEPTLHDVFQDWIDYKLSLNEIKKGTYDRYINVYKKFFLNTQLNEYKFKDIDEEILDTFIRKTITKYKLTNKSYSNLRIIIIGMFKYAKRRGYTSISISTFFKDMELSRRVFARNVKSKESQVFSQEEIPIIIEWLKKHPSVQNYGIVLTFQTGIREGELVGLKYSDIVGKVIHIQRQEIKYKDANTNKNVREIVDYVKSEAGNRYLILPPQALETIANIKKLNPFGEYMMMSNNKRINAQSFNDYLYKACDGCGLPKRSMHKIRKTYGTTLIDSGAEDSLIMSQMGHSDISTTRKYYYYSNKSLEYNEKQIENAISF